MLYQPLVVEIVLPALIVVVGLLVIGLAFAKLFKRASKNIAFIRTGLGGAKVVIDGGAFVIPVVHERVDVSLATQKLCVERKETDSLITRDKLRVDVTVEFFVRVDKTDEAIQRAAETFGGRTVESNALMELIQGKLVFALRSVAAQMDLDDLHQKRAEFVQQVQNAVMQDLEKNGLVLEGVSLTRLDQTDMKYFNADNAFDAEGLTKLRRIIEERRRERNAIVQDANVEIEAKNLDAERRALDIKREMEQARLSQAREVAVLTAEQKAQIAGEEARRNREAEQARIASQRDIEASKIETQKSLEAARIETQQSLETARIATQKSIDLERQKTEAEVATASQRTSQAQAEAARARVEAVQAEEAIVTTRTVAAAERDKQVALVEAARAVEEDALRITAKAHADREAAEELAEAVRTRATARSDEERILAAAKADQERMLAEARAISYEVDAKGQMALNAARNTIDPRIIELDMRLRLIDGLPAIVREMVKPMERIESIRVVDVTGLNPGGGEGAAGADAGLGSRLVDSALRYRAQAPVLEALLKEIGFDGRSLGSLVADGGVEKPVEAEPASA